MGCLPNSEQDIRIGKKRDEINDMQYQLKQHFESDLGTDEATDIETIHSLYQQIFGQGEEGLYKKAKNKIIDMKNEMIQSLEKENDELKKKIVGAVQAVNSDILIKEGTDSK